MVARLIAQAPSWTGGGGEASGLRNPGPPTAWPVVYKTRMSKEAADQVDWEDKEAIDFDEVWKVVKIHHTYR